MMDYESYFEKEQKRQHELAMAKAQNVRPRDWSWVATAVGYMSLAAVVIAAIVYGQ